MSGRVERRALPAGSCDEGGAGGAEAVEGVDDLDSSPPEDVPEDSLLVEGELEVVPDSVALEEPEDSEAPEELVDPDEVDVVEEAFAAVLVLLESAGSCPEASWT
jgi:hypothetical protein